MMTQDIFWKIIDDAKTEAGGDQDAMLKCTQARLAQLPANEIAEWTNIQNFYTKLADRDDLWNAGTHCKLYLSDDSFFYFRGWLLSQGRDVFSSVLRDPSTLSQHIEDPQKVYFESFTSVGYDVYCQKAFEEEYGQDGIKQFEQDWLAERPERTHFDFRWALSEKYDIYSACNQQPLSEEFKEILRQEIFAGAPGYDEKDASEKGREDGYVFRDLFGNDFTVYPTLDIYAAPSNNLYVGLNFYDKEWDSIDPYCDVTVNLKPMRYLEATLDTNNNGPQLVDFLVKNGFGEPTGAMIPSGFCVYPVFRFNEDKLKKIDPEMFAEYAQAHEKGKQPLADKIANAESKNNGMKADSVNKTNEHQNNRTESENRRNLSGPEY